jgi:hypothetical protein
MKMKLATTKEFRLAVRACTDFDRSWTERVENDNSKRYVGFAMFIGSTSRQEKVLAKVSDYLLERNLFVENLRFTGDGSYLRGKAAFVAR